MRLSPRWAAALYATLVVALLGYFMLDIPVQVTDSFQNILSVQRLTWRELIVSNLWSTGYMRPMFFAPIKVLNDLSNGHYYAWFRGFHVLQLAAGVAMFVALLRVRDWTRAAAVPIALAMYVGVHTFSGTIREGFPTNTFLTIVDCCLAAALIAASRPRWWSTPAAVLLLAFAAFSLESGVLVWVIVVAGFAAGWRGVPRWGVVALTLCVAAYFLSRYFIFDVGTPTLIERSTGFGLDVRDPDEIIALFGANPWPLYAYNVAASLASVLFAEPRGGVFWTVRHYLDGDLEPWLIVNVVACTSVTLLLARHVLSRRGRWRRWDLDHGDCLIFVFVAVLLANAAMNFVYTKDVVMSPAGAFFALAGYAAVTGWMQDLRRRARPGLISVVACACLAVVASAWTVKAVGIHYHLRYSARDVRSTWAYVDGWLEGQEISLADPRARALKEALEADALWLRPARPRFAIRWPGPGEWFDTSP